MDKNDYIHLSVVHWKYKRCRALLQYIVDLWHHDHKPNICYLLLLSFVVVINILWKCLLYIHLHLYILNTVLVIVHSKISFSFKSIHIINKYKMEIHIFILIFTEHYVILASVNDTFLICGTNFKWKSSSLLCGEATAGGEAHKWRPSFCSLYHYGT
jgi:hypothetical protein